MDSMHHHSQVVGTEFQNYQHPLLIDPIVGTVMKYLSVINLKNCRLACRKWSQLTILELRKKGKFDLKKHLAKLDGWTTQNHLFDCMNLESPFMTQHYSTIQLCTGSHLKKIIYKIIVEEYNLKEFQLILDQCPNIQDIELIFLVTDDPFDEPNFYRNLNQSTLEKVKCIDVNCDFEVESWLPDLMEACSALHTLRLQLQESRFKRIFNIFTDKSKLISNIQHLQVGGITYLFTVNCLEQFMIVPWQLSSLRIFVQNNVPSELMRNCLYRLSDTLIDLKLSWFCWNENDWGSSRESLIPLSLRKLEKLEINTNDNNVRAFFTENLNLIPTFVYAIQLPRLQSLRLNGTSTLGSFQKFFQNTSDDTRLTTQSLQRLSITGLFNDYSCFTRPVIPWPTFITEFNLAIQTIQPEVLASIFATMYHIEKLTLLFRDCREFPWEMILTGKSELVSRRVCGTNSAIQNQSSLLHCGNSIVNLKCLTSLKILGCRLTDLFIYNGLLHLNKLQYVYLPEAKFSKEALRQLREKLGPFTNLNFCAKSEDICKFIFDQPL